MNKLILLFIGVLISVLVISSQTINPPAERITIVADGNSPDPDDLGGTEVSNALLRAAGLAGRQVHYSHSCDLARVPRISEKAEKERQALMQSNCGVTARHWGGFDSLTFYDAKWQQILDFGIEEVRIPDQNIYLKVDIVEWDWADKLPDSRIQ